MSISQDSGAVTVCREVFDEASQPSNEEVLDYARRLGIDPDAEPHLLDLAREGLMAPLPKGWTPCHDEATGAWYYYHAGTRTTTWEHPLDSKNRAIVERARATSSNRQQSLEDDSKTTAKDFESQDDGTSTRDPKSPITMTKIPTKLAPLRKSSVDTVRRRDTSRERISRRSNSNDGNNGGRHDFPISGGSSSTSSLMTDRASRDYTNIVFQDPKFYETPRLLDSPERELKLREIVERSESMSPRYEKDWQQLSGKFTSDESNVIDIDKLSAFANISENRGHTVDKIEKEKHPRNLSQQRELTLSGGGSIYLKSNRSRDATPCQENAKIDDFSTANDAANDNPVFIIGDRPKSILRDKPAEDDERPTDEERKSVRFDLEKLPDEIKFTFTSFDDENEEEDDDENDNDNDNDENEDDDEIPVNLDLQIPCGTGLRKSESFYESLQKFESHRTIDSVEKRSGKAWSTTQTDDTDDGEKKMEGEKVDTTDIDCSQTRSSMVDDAEDSSSRVRDVEKSSREVSRTSDETGSRTRVIGRRFVVENVTEKEHQSQLRREDSNDADIPLSKFVNVRNIDIFSRSDNETRSNSHAQQESTISSSLDDIRRSKEAMLESMKRTDMRAKMLMEREKNEVYQMMKLRHDLEAVNAEQKRGRQQKRHQRRDEELSLARRDAEAKLDAARREIEANFSEEKLRLETELAERLAELRRELARQETEEIEKLMKEMNETRTVNLTKVRNELEICYEKERQDILENLKVELDQRKRELLQFRNQEMEKLNDEHEREICEERVLRIAEREMTQRNNEKIETMRRELDKEFEDLKNELRCQQREKVTKITEDHEKCLAEILKDFRNDEGLARKVYKQRLDEIRSDFSRDTDKEAKKQAERLVRQETADYEKMRCEKRLLEDKYKTLKDKYSKLKNDVRLAVERRSKRKEGNATTSETEKSTSARTRTDPSDQKASPTNTRSSSIANTGHHLRKKTSLVQPEITNPNKSQAEDSEIVGSRSATNFQKSIIVAAVSAAAAGGGDCSSRSSVKFESDDATTASETVNSNILKNKRKSFARRSSSSLNKSQNNNNNANVTDNPVENIRKQLEKLEDLGDQLPSNETAYTLRYPFQDKAPANASSELEFFRHRIHVERDSVKRAREALRVQRSAFQSRQRAWKQKSVRATLEQLVQEERELSDMEVSLHRTRSLLGEKVIYLRHLEQSLERVASAKRNESESLPTKNDEMTLSDMSSASSGFSSTDIGTDTFIDKPDHYQESTEIIASLENLNSEIREIWGVLNKRQDNNIPPPPTLMYSDLGWLPFQHLTTQSSNVQGFGTPNIQSNILSQLTGSHPPTTTTQNIIAQYGPNSGFTTSVGTVERGASSLIERTRHMRDWLRQARMESTDLISPGQATL